MIKKVQLSNCLTLSIKELPYVDYYEDRQSKREFIKLVPKDVPILKAMGCMNSRNELVAKSIGISRTMNDVINRGHEITAYIVRDGPKYFIKHNSYFYLPKWFNYVSGNGINEELRI